MPSSPDAAVWSPPEFGAGERRPAPPASGPQAPFEVSPTFGIPEAVLAPARAAAANEGYVNGWNRGHRDGLAQAAAEAQQERRRAEAEQARALAEVERAGAALRAAAQSLAAREVAAATDIEELIVTSAYAVAEAIVGVTLADDLQRGRAVVARALSLVPADEPVLITVSRADVNVVGDLVHHRKDVTLAVDPGLPPGDAYAAFGAGTIDARISVALDRVRTALATHAAQPAHPRPYAVPGDAA